MPGGIARSLRVTAQRSGQGSKTAAEAASAAQMRADLDGENGVARWVQQQASPPLPRCSDWAERVQEIYCSRRLKESNDAHLPGASSTKAVRDFLRIKLGTLEHEVFAVIHLDAQHRVIEYVEMFRGTVTQTSVYPREVVKEAMAHNTAAIVLVHNHPSGVAEPSRADEHLTQTLKSALSLVDVRVIDHLIVAGPTILSFAERGLI